MQYGNGQIWKIVFDEPLQWVYMPSLMKQSKIVTSWIGIAGAWKEILQKLNVIFFNMQILLVPDSAPEAFFFSTRKSQRNLLYGMRLASLEGEIRR
jgi:hypothetical protein